MMRIGDVNLVPLAVTRMKWPHWNVSGVKATKQPKCWEPTDPMIVSVST